MDKYDSKCDSVTHITHIPIDGYISMCYISEIRLPQFPR